MLGGEAYDLGEAVGVEGIRERVFMLGDCNRWSGRKGSCGEWGRGC